MIQNPGVNVKKKLFYSSPMKMPNKLEPSRFSIQGWALSSSRKNWPILKNLTMEKLSILFGLFFDDEEKVLYPCHLLTML